MKSNVVALEGTIVREVARVQGENHKEMKAMNTGRWKRRAR